MWFQWKNSASEGAGMAKGRPILKDFLGRLEAQSVNWTDLIVSSSISAHDGYIASPQLEYPKNSNQITGDLTSTIRSYLAETRLNRQLAQLTCPFLRSPGRPSLLGASLNVSDADVISRSAYSLTLHQFERSVFNRDLFCA
jgi:hypothetical protein